MAAEDLPKIESRSRRLAAYLNHNRNRMLIDAAVLLAWLIVTWTVFIGFIGVPRWLYYIVLFAGVIIYSRITPPWERPYRSPDLSATSG